MFRGVVSGHKHEAFIHDELMNMIENPLDGQEKQQEEDPYFEYYERKRKEKEANDKRKQQRQEEQDFLHHMRRMRMSYSELLDSPQRRVRGKGKAKKKRRAKNKKKKNSKASTDQAETDKETDLNDHVDRIADAGTYIARRTKPDPKLNRIDPLNVKPANYKQFVKAHKTYRDIYHKDEEEMLELGPGPNYHHFMGNKLDKNPLFASASSATSAFRQSTDILEWGRTNRSNKYKKRLQSERTIIAQSIHSKTKKERIRRVGLLRTFVGLMKPPTE